MEQPQLTALGTLGGKHDRHGQALILTREQVFAVAEAMPSPKWRMLVLLMYGCAARVGEASKLKCADIDLSTRQVRFRASNTKTGKLRYASLPQWLYEELSAYLPTVESDWLFPGRTAAVHLNDDACHLRLKKVFRELGLPGASSHSFRRSALTALANQGVPLQVIASVSGHQSLSGLQAYLAVSPQQNRAAVELL